MKKLLSLILVSFSFYVTLSADTTYQLSPLTSFGINSDGSVRPGDAAWVSVGNNNRGLAVDQASTNVIFVNPNSGSGGNATFVGVGTIERLNGDTGAEINTLNPTNISGGSYAASPAAVADDGAVYVANQVTTSSSALVKIYRYDSVSSTEPPRVVFAKTIDPSSRYGISMDARGSGAGTQIIMGSSTASAGSGTNILLFTVFDDSIGSGPATASATAADVGANATFYVTNDTVAYEVYAYRTATNAGVRLYSVSSGSISAVTSNDNFVVNLTWAAVPGAEGYRVLRNTNSAGFLDRLDVSGTSLTDTNNGWVTGATATPTNGPFLQAAWLVGDFTNNTSRGQFSDGIAFGTNNTFWSKTEGYPLRYMSFDLGASNCTTLQAYYSSNWPGSSTFTAIGIDTNRNLLAAMDAPVSAGVKYVRLYDISNPNQPPVLLDIKSYVSTLTTAPGTTPPANAKFGGNGTRLYTHVMNNGLQAFNVNSITMPPPTIFSAPAATNRVAVGASLTLSVTAFPAVSYQWQSNGFNIAGATANTLTLQNIQTTYATNYTCVITNAAGSTNVSSRLEVVNPADLFHLSLIWRKGVSGEVPYINLTGGSGNSPSTRWIGYNGANNHLYAAVRSSSTTSNYDIWVIDGTNGAPLYTLNTNGIVLGVGQGGIGVTCVGVSDDGSVYACNEAPNAYADGGGDPSKYFRIYRWANDDSNTVPTQVFQGDPSSQPSPLRWGDTMDVRGSGTNTQIILDTNTRETSNTKKKVAILKPTDATLTSFYALWIQGDNLPSAATPSTSPPTGQNASPIGKSIQFDYGVNGYWIKNKSGWLLRNTFDTNTPGPFGFPNIDYSLTSIASNGLGNGVYGLAVHSGLNLAAGVSTNGTLTVADKLNLYDMSTPGSPLLLAQYSFPTIPANANANFISCTLFASNSTYGAMVFSLSGNNGIMAFRVKSGPLEPPSFSTQPKNLRLIEGGTGSLSVATLEPADFTWEHNGGTGYTNVPGITNSTLTITSAVMGDAGSYRAIATNVISGSATSSVAIVTVTRAEDAFVFSPIWSKTIGSESYLTLGANATPLQRSLGYSAKTHQLFIINRTAGSSGLSVNVLDPDTGAKLYELKTNGISVLGTTPYSSDNLILVMLAVADDGAIYAGNVSMANNSATNANFRLWRWADSDSNTLPQLVYEGEPANSASSLRWGDTMHVRGSGENTEIIIDNQRSGVLSAAAVLKPVNSSMTLFTNKPFLHLYGTLTIGRSIQFGQSTSVWQKAYAGGLKLSTYNLSSQTSALVTNYDVFPATLGGLFMAPKFNLAVGVDFTGTTGASPDTANLYDISDLSTPMLIGKYNFPTNHVPNDNHITHAVFTRNKAFVLNANNGIVAFDIIGPYLDIFQSGNNSVISWFTNQPNYVLQSTPGLSPTNWTNEGSTPAVIGNRNVVTNNVSDTKMYRLKR